MLILEFLIFILPGLFIPGIFAILFALRFYNKDRMLNAVGFFVALIAYGMIYYVVEFEHNYKYQQEPTIPSQLRKDVYELEKKWENRYKFKIEKLPVIDK